MSDSFNSTTGRSNIVMPSPADFDSLRLQEFKSYDQYCLSLRSLGLDALLDYQKNTPTGMRNVFNAVNGQWNTTEQNGSGSPLNLDYMTCLQSFLLSEFRPIDRVLCVDYENIYFAQKSNTNQFIFEMAKNQVCNKILLIAKTMDTKEGIKKDFQTQEVQDDMLKKGLECKTLFLSSSCLYFMPLTLDQLQIGQEKWAREPKNAPTFMTDTWQKMLDTLSRDHLKKLRGVDDSIIVVACHLLRRYGIGVKLLTGDRKIFVDFVTDQKYLPNFRCDAGSFVEGGKYKESSRFGVRFYSSPLKITENDVTILIENTILYNQQHQYSTRVDQQTSSSGITASQGGPVQYTRSGWGNRSHFRDKYLKYKEKYMALKRKLGI